MKAQLREHLNLGGSVCSVLFSGNPVSRMPTDSRKNWLRIKIFQKMMFWVDFPSHKLRGESLFSPEICVERGSSFATCDCSWLELRIHLVSRVFAETPFWVFPLDCSLFRFPCWRNVNGFSGNVGWNLERLKILPFLQKNSGLQVLKRECLLPRDLCAQVFRGEMPTNAVKRC